MYTRWNIYTNQMKAKNYTSWNIETKPMTLVTYSSRCRKLHLNLNFAHMFRWVKPRGRTLYEGLGAVPLLPVKWSRLTCAIGTSLRRRHIACDDQRHMKPIPDEMFIHKANLQWNLPVTCLYIKQICSETYQMRCLYIKWNLPDQMFIHKANFQWNLPVKCLYIKWIYITLHNTPNKISKNIFMSFGHYYKYFGKKPKIQV